MGTSPLPVLRQGETRKGGKKGRKKQKNRKKQNKTKPKKTKQTNKEKQKERKKNTGLKRFRTHELCHILGQCIAYCMHVVHTVHTLSFFFKCKNVGFSGQAECSYFPADFSLQYSCIILEL